MSIVAILTCHVIVWYRGRNIRNIFAFNNKTTTCDLYENHIRKTFPFCFRNLLVINILPSLLKYVNSARGRWKEQPLLPTLLLREACGVFQCQRIEGFVWSKLNAHRPLSLHYGGLTVSGACLFTCHTRDRNMIVWNGNLITRRREAGQLYKALKDSSCLGGKEARFVEGSLWLCSITKNMAGSQHFSEADILAEQFPDDISVSALCDCG